MLKGKKNFFFNGRDFDNPNFKKTQGRGVQHEFARFMNIYSYPSTVFYGRKLYADYQSYGVLYSERNGTLSEPYFYRSL